MRASASFDTAGAASGSTLIWGCCQLAPRLGGHQVPGTVMQGYHTLQLIAYLPDASVPVMLLAVHVPHLVELSLQYQFAGHVAKAGLQPASVSA